MGIGAIAYTPGRAQVVEYLTPFDVSSRAASLLTHVPGFRPMWHSIILPFQSTGELASYH